MKVLVTTAESQLQQKLAVSLAGDHDVVLTGRGGNSTGQRYVRSDLGHDPQTNDLVRDMDAIIHSGEADPELSAPEQLDAAMRCTYNLLWAAAEEHVPRLVYLSSLRVMARYGEEMAVTERWRPVPTVDVPVLCFHLGEYVCREFAREKKLAVVCLRLGEMVWDERRRARGPSSALYLDDAVQSVKLALSADLSGWNIFHIQSAVPNARYLTTAARQALGYAPAQRR